MSSRPDISVLIPTYNRASILDQCLSCLASQSFPSDRFEVVVGNDGSTDETLAVLKDWEEKASFSLRSFSQSNQGQGIVRNKALDMAKGRVVLFIGDDILVHPDFLSSHWAVHERHPEENVAVLGFIDWHESLEVTPYMQWLTNGSAVFGRFGGHQFAFEKLEGKEWADYRFFYTSNLSLKRSLFDHFAFDDRFCSYGWEDIELGYRLSREVGLKLRYEPKAIAYHLHHLDESTMPRRMRSIGQSAWLLHDKYPELKRIPSFQKKMIFRMLGSDPLVAFFKTFSSFSPVMKNLYYYALSKRYFLEGVQSGPPVSSESSS